MNNPTFSLEIQEDANQTDAVAVGTKNFPRWEIGRLRWNHSLGSDCVLSLLVVVVLVIAERICGHPDP